MTRNALVLFAGVLLVAQPAWSDDDDASHSELIEALESYVPRVVKVKGTPGLAIALSVKGRQVWARGFGFADLGKKIAMTENTVFPSGSMGKLYTATAVMQLVEAGVLDLDAPISTYLEDLRIKNPLGGRQPSVRDFLTHRSGLSKNAAGSTFGTPQPLKEHLRRGYASLHFPSYGGNLVRRWSSQAGKKFDYSNFGIATLGYLVEATNPDGLSFSEYVSQKIMRPLNMASSCYPPVQDGDHVPAELLSRRSTGYMRLGGVQIPTPEIAFADYPAGTALLTVEDHLRLLNAFRANSSGDQRILKPATIKEMLKPQVALGKDRALGLVWFLRQMGKPNYNFGHAGAHMYGWRNDSRVYPTQDWALVVATNQWDVGRRSNPTDKDEATLIAEFVSSWLRTRSSESKEKVPHRSWAWKTSYVMGLVTAENIRGALGIAEPIGDKRLKAMVEGCQPAGLTDWDPGAFRQGVRDLERAGFSLQAIRAFLISSRCRVEFPELEVITRELGYPGLPATWRGLR